MKNWNKEKRKSDLKSKNADVVKFERIKQEMLKCKSIYRINKHKWYIYLYKHTTHKTNENLAATTGRKSNDAKHQLDSQTRLALIQQILYDDEQLKSLIDKSDSTIKIVKDLFANTNSSNEDNTNANEIENNHMINNNNTVLIRF